MDCGKVAGGAGGQGAGGRGGPDVVPPPGRKEVLHLVGSKPLTWPEL